MFQNAKEIHFYIFDKSETQYININSIICILKTNCLRQIESRHTTSHLENQNSYFLHFYSN